MSDLLNKTQEYIQAFDAKDIEKLSYFFADESELFDPANPNGVRGKSNIIEMISGLFKEFELLKFKALNIFEDHNTTLIEFSLTLNDKSLKGVDVVEWKNHKILSLRAYLY